MKPSNLTMASLLLSIVFCNSYSHARGDSDDELSNSSTGKREKQQATSDRAPKARRIESAPQSPPSVAAESPPVQNDVEMSQVPNLGKRSNHDSSTESRPKAQKTASETLSAPPPSSPELKNAQDELKKRVVLVLDNIYRGAGFNAGLSLNDSLKNTVKLSYDEAERVKAAIYVANAIEAEHPNLEATSAAVGIAAAYATRETFDNLRHKNVTNIYKNVAVDPEFNAAITATQDATRNAAKANGATSRSIGTAAVETAWSYELNPKNIQAIANRVRNIKLDPSHKPNWKKIKKLYSKIYNKLNNEKDPNKRAADVVINFFNDAKSIDFEKVLSYQSVQSIATPDSHLSRLPKDIHNVIDQYRAGTIDLILRALTAPKNSEQEASDPKVSGAKEKMDSAPIQGEDNQKESGKGLAPSAK